MSKSVSFVNISDVLSHIGFGDNECWTILDYGFGNVSHGDADYTLVGNNLALYYILDGADQVDDLDEGFTTEYITEKFWEVVGNDDYINLEN